MIQNRVNRLMLDLLEVDISNLKYKAGLSGLHTAVERKKNAETSIQKANISFKIIMFCRNQSILQHISINITTHPSCLYDIKSYASLIKVN